VATPFGQAPRFPIPNRARKYEQPFTREAAGSKIEILKTPYRAPKANAIRERFLGSVRRECLDHMLILGESHLYRVIKEYVKYFNQARPRQGIERQIPEGNLSERKDEQKGKIIGFPVLDGLHHDYRRVA
jgi:putative transposase